MQELGLLVCLTVFFFVDRRSCSVILKTKCKNNNLFDFVSLLSSFWLELHVRHVNVRFVHNICALSVYNR